VSKQFFQHLIVFAALVATAAPTAFAGHPMLSEDTGTQGRGNAELELGYAWSRQDSTDVFLFQPQLSLGAWAPFDFILQPSYTVIQTPDGHREEGLGDTNLDFKWRFYGSAPWTLAVRGGLELPTAHGDLGLPHNRVSGHGLLVITGDFQPFAVDINLGFTRSPALLNTRPNLWHYSTALSYQANERMFVILDTSLDSNSDSTRATPPLVTLFGFIYTIRPGLDVDLGYRQGLNPDAPEHQFLLGITYRGAP
jgi:hypothetical protein